MTENNLSQIERAAHLLKNKGELTIQVKVTPKSQKNALLSVEMSEDENVSLTVKLRGIPAKGEVNRNLLKFLSEIFDIAPSNCHLLRGHKSRDKTVLLHAI